MAVVSVPQRRLRVAVSLTVLIVLAGCGGTDSPSGSTGTDTSTSAAASGGAFAPVEAGKLTTCTHLPYAPFQFEQGGEVVGFDVDLVDLVATELGLEQAIVDTPFEGIKSGQDLNTGKCDIAAAGMTITDERKAVIDFTDPYFDATQALLVKTGAGYQELADLDGKTLGVQSGTTGKDYVTNANPAGVEVTEFEDLATELQALSTGQVEAVVNDLPVLLNYIKTNPGDYEVAAEFDTGEQYGFGIKKGANPELLAATNTVLERSRADGTYAALYEKWFGVKPSS
jgi:polar amino acid transport system substrate-binding protein